MGNTKCHRKGGKIIINGNHNAPAHRGTGLPYVGKPSLKGYSDEINPERIKLRAVQTRMSKRAAKPTLPKLPWD